MAEETNAKRVRKYLTHTKKIVDTHTDVCDYNIAVNRGDWLELMTVRDSRTSIRNDTMAIKLSPNADLTYFKADDNEPGTVIEGYLIKVGLNSNVKQSIESYDIDVYNPTTKTTTRIGINKSIARGLNLLPMKPYEPQVIPQLGETVIGYWVEIEYLGKELMRDSQKKPKEKLKPMDYFKKFDVTIHEDNKQGGVPKAPVAPSAPSTPTEPTATSEDDLWL